MEEHNSCELSDGEIKVWLEQEAIHINAVDRFGDPAELTKAQALELAEVLKRLAGKMQE